MYCSFSFLLMDKLFSMEITQRPAAGNMLVSLAMQSLTVTG